MPRTRAFYSVLQYVPDGGRAEAANADVVLFVPETGLIEVRTGGPMASWKRGVSDHRADAGGRAKVR